MTKNLLLNLSRGVNRMNPDDVDITSDERVRLLDELQDLLAKLLQLARHGDSANEAFGVLAGKAGSLVDDMRRTGLLDLDKLRYRREELRKLYEKLCLIVAAQRVHTHKELSRICKGRKTIETYRSSIRS